MTTDDSCKKKWKAAIYIRLSKEDYEKDDGESVSVTNQREILKEYIRQHPDIELFDTYIDDGFTGTDFDRPDWKRLMKDIEAGNIDCVIVKDLNRLGRNYTISGDLIDNYFARRSIRFIAINNCIDTMDSGMNAATRCISIGVTNVINESYSAMTSVSIRGTLNSHRRQGKFIGSFPAYGFFKDPTDYHKLIIDEKAAAIVRMIFEKFISGRSILGITKDLNSLGIPNPTLYKQQLGWNFRPNAYDNSGKWSDHTVRRILQNEMYIGNMVQGKNRTVSYKVHECRSVPKKEWFIVEGTHDPIISKETFELAQSLFKRPIRSSPITQNVDLLSGLIFCADCGKPMCKTNSRMSKDPSSKTYCYYRCSTRSKHGGCSFHSIRRDKLFDALLKYIQTMEQLYVDSKRFLSELKSCTKQKDSSLKPILNARIAERDRYLKAQMELYPDWKNGSITHEEYVTLKKGLGDRIAELNRMIDGINANQKGFESNADPSANAQNRSTTDLSRKLLIELIDRIYVHENNRIKIVTKFKGLE